MADIFQLKIALRGAMCEDFPASYCTRTIEISGASRLKRLAQAILESYEFAFDHAFGFYSNIRNYSRSEEKYTLFADLDDAEDEEIDGKSVSKTTTKRVFEPGKTMLFLFDYGEEWIFHVTCLSVHEREPDKTYPLLVEARGQAPEQYPDYEEDEDEDDED